MCIARGAIRRSSESRAGRSNRSGRRLLRFRELAQRNSGRSALTGGSTALRDVTALVTDVVDESVLAEAVGTGEERAALVDAGQLLDELREHPALLEHERVDGDALARAALDFLQRLLERAPCRRIGEVRLQAFHVGGRLAVGDHDDLLVAALLPPQELPRELEAVVHVGADVPFGPRELRELLGLELARIEREAEDVQAV